MSRPKEIQHPTALSVRIESAVFRRIKAIARRRGQSFSATVRDLLSHATEPDAPRASDAFRRDAEAGDDAADQRV